TVPPTHYLPCAVAIVQLRSECAESLVRVGMIDGLPDTRIDEAGITAALRALGIRSAEFRRIDV
ncbi:MAG: hypothetical protein AB7I68_14760, partial [Porticoccaceae bacterium]